MAIQAQTKSLHARTWLVSAAIVVGVMLLLGLLAGPFGAVFMALSAAFLVMPAAVIFVVAARVIRDRNFAAVPVVVVTILGWLLALSCGALIGSIVSPGASSSMNLDATPVLFWLALLAPFALVGAAVATTWTLVRQRAQSRGALG